MISCTDAPLNMAERSGAMAKRWRGPLSLGETARNDSKKLLGVRV